MLRETTLIIHLNILPLVATEDAPTPPCPEGLPAPPWPVPPVPGGPVGGPGGPIGPSSVLFLRKYFSSLARMCLPYVYFFSVLQ